MKGIDLNKPITFIGSSLRFFDENEHHCTRFCKEDVLYMVYEGVLRFSEDGVEYEIHPGEYHIQKSNTFQSGDLPSDSPKYLYVHFSAEWSEEENVLLPDGNFNYIKLKPFMEELNNLFRHYSGNLTYIERADRFFKLLSLLYRTNTSCTAAGELAAYINDEYLNIASLDILCKRFNFSKNHIINIFKKEYNMTPFEYINTLKIKKAMHLLEVTAKTTESIACECGFNHYSHFYRLFYRKCGISPQKWRNNALNMAKQPTVKKPDF